MVFIEYAVPDLFILWFAVSPSSPHPSYSPTINHAHHFNKLVFTKCAEPHQHQVRIITNPDMLSASRLYLKYIHFLNPTASPAQRMTAHQAGPISQTKRHLSHNTITLTASSQQEKTHHPAFHPQPRIYLQCTLNFLNESIPHRTPHSEPHAAEHTFSTIVVCNADLDVNKTLRNSSNTSPMRHNGFFLGKIRGGSVDHIALIPSNTVLRR